MPAYGRMKHVLLKTGSKDVLHTGIPPSSASAIQQVAYCLFNETRVLEEAVDLQEAVRPATAATRAH